MTVTERVFSTQEHCLTAVLLALRMLPAPSSCLPQALPGLSQPELSLRDQSRLVRVHTLQSHQLPLGNTVLSRRVWDVNTGEVLNTLIHHNEAVLHLRFSNGLMVTCSKDRSIAVWDMASPTDITLRRVLVGHRAAVNVVDFDDKYIVSASGDRTIKASGRALLQGCVSPKESLGAAGGFRSSSGPCLSGVSQ